MCLYPKLIANPKYKVNKKNGGKVPAVFDKRVLLVPIGCKECIECMRKKSREVQIRLLEEIKIDKKGVFVSLTFSNESYNALSKECDGEGYELDNNIAKLAVKRFLERWKNHTKKSVKHWFVTELGSSYTEHLHIHGIIFTDEKSKIKERWKYGYVHLGTWVDESTVSYITKYITKKDEIHKEYKGIILTSKGIGKGYIDSRKSIKNRYMGENTDESYTSDSGHKMELPIYYRNHLYTDDEKELLWINKLNKNTRYVLGSEIDMNTNEKEYWKALEEAQIKNSRLGYGKGKKDWERIEYEKNKRILMQARRGVEKKKD